MSNIKATFTAGVDTITVHGLHQWDYGRILEISHPDLPAMMEIHFANASAKEAIVRVAEGTNGVTSVVIPAALLEQTSPIHAWVYIVSETAGETVLTVILPVVQRARPAAAATMPEEIGDKYTEAVGAVNELVESLKEGNVKVASAVTADSATEAMRAVQDENGNNIAATYTRISKPTFVRWSEGSILATNCLYEFMVEVAPYNAVGYVATAISRRDPTKITMAALGLGYNLAISPAGNVAVYGTSLQPIDDANLIGIYYRQI